MEDVLQYSQRDLGRAVEVTPQGTLLLKSRCRELHMKNLPMDKIMDGFEEIVSQAMAEALKKKEPAKATNQKEETPAPTCRGTWAPREGGAAEPALTRKGARVLAAQAPARRSEGGGVGAVPAGEGGKEEPPPSLRDAENSWASSTTHALINKLKPLEEEEEEEDLGAGGPRLGLLMMVLGFIHMNQGNSAREAQGGVCPSKDADNISTSLGTRRGLLWKSSCSSNTSIAGRCLTPIHQMVHSLGSPKKPGKSKILGFVAKLHEKAPQHWQVQYHEALAGKVNRVRAEASMRVRPGIHTSEPRASSHSQQGQGVGELRLQDFGSTHEP
ncbi:hypothetical protein QTO34_014629 [Cnephaeus nilssonii]|uniref:Uncharacterized protein n=1 Tax=Cnephaeus nilssonii TaxID=3371016 RepID=A0AA40LSG1_CNENI|nr:hypothetical protein QTO34_014629 [Eptesicus nilssonii]